MEKIANFEELIRDHVGSNKILIEAKVSNLMSAGENYMSDILRIHLTLKNNNTGEEENEYFIAKLTINNPIVADGNTARLTKNEYAFYTKILPKIRDFEQKHDILPSDFFPKFIAGRINLNGSDIPDKDGVLLLEDLSLQGFRSADRHIGFKLDAVKHLLNDLAKFHAIPLAMRLLDPMQYETEIRTHCEGFIPNVSDVDPNAAAFGALNLMGRIIQSESSYSYIWPKYQLFSSRIRSMLERNPKRFFGNQIMDAFETLSHSDFWTNNILQKYYNGYVIKNMFLDFQMIQSNTLISDLMFFLITSVELTCLRKDFNELIRFYYEKLSGILDKLQCLTSEHTYEKFLEAFKKGSQPAIYQSTFMLLTVITAQKGKKFNQLKIAEVPVVDVPQIAKERLCFIFQEGFQRGWLDTDID